MTTCKQVGSCTSKCHLTKIFVQIVSSYKSDKDVDLKQRHLSCLAASGLSLLVDLRRLLCLHATLFGGGVRFVCDLTTKQGPSALFAFPFIFFLEADPLRQDFFCRHWAEPLGEEALYVVGLADVS